VGPRTNSAAKERPYPRTLTSERLRGWASDGCRRTRERERERERPLRSLSTRAEIAKSRVSLPRVGEGLG